MVLRPLISIHFKYLAMATNRKYQKKSKPILNYVKGKKLCIFEKFFKMCVRLRMVLFSWSHNISLTQLRYLRMSIVYHKWFQLLYSKKIILIFKIRTIISVDCFIPFKYLWINNVVVDLSLSLWLIRVLLKMCTIID